jgi:hypothetical protein
MRVCMYVFTVQIRAGSGMTAPFAAAKWSGVEQVDRRRGIAYLPRFEACCLFIYIVVCISIKNSRQLLSAKKRMRKRSSVPSEVAQMEWCIATTPERLRVLLLLLRRKADYWSDSTANPRSEW